jgi:hypothetical protein
MASRSIGLQVLPTLVVGLALCLLSACGDDEAPPLDPATLGCSPPYLDKLKANNVPYESSSDSSGKTTYVVKNIAYDQAISVGLLTPSASFLDQTTGQVFTPKKGEVYDIYWGVTTESPNGTTQYSSNGWTHNCRYEIMPFPFPVLHK